MNLELHTYIQTSILTFSVTNNGEVTPQVDMIFLKVQLKLNYFLSTRVYIHMLYKSLILCSPLKKKKVRNQMEEIFYFKIFVMMVPLSRKYCSIICLRSWSPYFHTAKQIFNKKYTFLS